MDIEVHYVAFQRSLASLILEYRVDVASGIAAPDLAAYLVDTIAAAQELANRLVDYAPREDRHK